MAKKPKRPSKPTRLRPLADIVEETLDAIRQATHFADELTFEQFCADEKTCRAIERCLEIISEASRHVPADVQEKYPAIPWRNIADSGNVFRHVYHQVSLRIIWDTVIDDLPPLREVMEAIKAELE